MARGLDAFRNVAAGALVQDWSARDEEGTTELSKTSSRAPRGEAGFEVFCGIDVACEMHHAVALNGAGDRLVDRPLPTSAALVACAEVRRRLVGAPESNVDRFRHRPSHELAALLPNRRDLDDALDDLRAADVDVSTVQILHGSEGARILDPTGAEHGLLSTIVRFLQNLGYDESILAVYYEALDNGEALLTVPCPAADRYRLGQLLIARGAHGVVYFGTGSAETLTAP